MKSFSAVLIGQPNSGKSTLFKMITDNRSSLAGATVDINSSEIDFYGTKFRIVDLPGLYSLNPTHPAEEITTKYLMNQNIDLIINVVDASMLTRSLELTVELMELGLPMIVVLNMTDIADNNGIKINYQQLETIIGTTVVPTQAVYGKGIKELTDIALQKFNSPRNAPMVLKYTHHLEVKLNAVSADIEPHLKGLNGSPRFYAIKAIENPDMLPNHINELIESSKKAIDDEIYGSHHKDAFESISLERHHLAMSISEQVTTYSKVRKAPLSEKFDNWLLHPIFGYFFVIAFFFIYFFTIFIVGDFFSKLSAPPLDWLSGQIDSLKNVNEFLWHTVNGAFLGFSGILGIVLPYFLPLVFLTSIYEESGYLSRVAFLVDGLMHKIGLHGKSVAPFILGFGCSVPAIYATRMIENKRDRIITSILIPFLPCSARIAVIFALSVVYAKPLWAIVVYVTVLFAIAIHGKILSKFLKNHTPLIMDIPRLKIPSLKQSFNKTRLKINDFVKEAILFLVVGSVVLGWIEYFNVAHYLDYIFSPIVSSLLGLPEKLGSTLLFGFFRKELILVMANQALGVQTLAQLPMTADQTLVFIIFVTFYFPCFTTFVVIWKEFGWKIVTMSSLLSIFIAIVASLIFKIILAQLQNFI